MTWRVCMCVVLTYTRHSYQNLLYLFLVQLIHNTSPVRFCTPHQTQIHIHTSKHSPSNSPRTQTSFLLALSGRPSDSTMCFTVRFAKCKGALHKRQALTPHSKTYFHCVLFYYLSDAKRYCGTFKTP